MIQLLSFTFYFTSELVVSFQQDFCHLKSPEGAAGKPARSMMLPPAGFMKGMMVGYFLNLTTLKCNF